MTQGVSNPPQWTYPGDTGASVAGSYTTSSTPREHIGPIHEMPHNQDVGDTSGGLPDYGQNGFSSGNRSNGATPKRQIGWSPDQPKPLGMPGAWIDIDQDNAEGASTGDNDKANALNYDENKTGNDSWENDKTDVSNNNENWSSNEDTDWQNESCETSNKNNSNTWESNKSGWQNNNNDNLNNNHNHNWNEWQNDANDSSNNNDVAGLGDSWDPKTTSKKDGARERIVVDFANANNGNTASINHQSWGVQEKPHQNSPNTKDVSSNSYQLPVHNHRPRGHTAPILVSQAGFTNQTKSDPVGSSQNQHSTSHPTSTQLRQVDFTNKLSLGPLGSSQFPQPMPYSTPLAESRDHLNILNQAQGTQEKPSLPNNADNAASLYQPVSKPLDPSPKSYWGQWKSNRQEQSPHSRSPDHSSAKAQLLNQETTPRRRLSHQVHRGKPLLYAHKVASPSYMDSHEQPYATFVFHYRSKGMYTVKF